SAGPHLQDRRPRAPRGRRPHLLPRQGGHADQEPRLPHRAGRDRGGAPFAGGPEGKWGRGGPVQWIRGVADLVRVRARGGERCFGGQATREPRGAPPDVYAPRALDASRRSAQERQRQDRSPAPEKRVRSGGIPPGTDGGALMEPRWTREAIMRGLGDLFVESLHFEAPPPDTDLFERATLDSLQLVELLLQLERRFSVRVAIENIDLDQLRTLERIDRLVEAASPVEISSGKRVA